MIIQSKFKDYYDFVAGKYGGGDPKIVYTRNKLKVTYVNARCPLRDLNRSYFGYKEDKLDRAYLVFCGRVYVLAKPRSTDIKFSVNDYRIEDIPNEDQIKKLSIWKRPNYGIELGKQHRLISELCYLVGAPVFVIHSIYHSDPEGIEMYDNIPILGTIGMPSILSPEQAYQELSMFMGNYMKRPTDTQPPVSLANKQRIVKAGFDLRTSFRHR